MTTPATPEPALPSGPIYGLFERYSAAEHALEQTHPTGDPMAFVCHLVGRDGYRCGKPKVMTGRPGNKVAMCPSCDQPDTDTSLPDWTGGA